MGLHVRSLGPRIVALAISLIAPSFASGQTVGPNVNMVSGTQWPGGDPFLQRQNEPSVAVSSRNPFHILAGANDYRSVDLALTTNGETGDAWLGLFKSLDGGATWRSILLPGCPYNTSICAGAPAVKNAGYQAAADPTVRAGTNGMFYYAGLVFNRGFNPHSAIIVSRLIDLNNKENADPTDILNGDAIQYISTSIVASGTSSQFLDKPTMAVDIPRASATTCNLTVNQPGNGTVRQSFPAGNVYLAYTSFVEPPNTDPAVTASQDANIFFVRSKNCGATWSSPVFISSGSNISQGAVIAINPVRGTVYVVWRQFKTTTQPDAIVGVTSVDGGATFSAPVRVSTFAPFDEGTTNTSFRTNAYPTAAFDGSGRMYVAYSARNTVPSGDARIVMTTSTNGTSWTPPTPVDNPPIDPINNPLGRGHQIMPALTFAAGRLSLLYYDLRLDHTLGIFSPLLTQGQPTGFYTELPALAGELGLTPPLISSVFNAFIDDSTISLRRHTFDLRVAQALPAAVPVFAPSVLVSQYAYGCCAANQTDIEQLQFNVPNLPIFRSGTAPFMGDYLDIAPSPQFLPPTDPFSGTNTTLGDADADDWQFNISSSTPTIYHAAWTDNRDVQAPADGNWAHYTPPNSPSVGTTSIFQPGTTVPTCQVGFTGSRNQNIYTAPISGGLVFGAPGNTKQLGTTVFNGQAVPFQRAFSVVAQNATNVVKSFRLTIANQPVGGNASFLQFAQLTTLDVSIPALSSATRPVFVTSTNPTASVTVNIAEITAPSGTLVPGGLTSFTTLNPDATNPAITNPAITNPAITNPAITNFEVTNPAITNPAITNPAITNPAITNPAITNPAITNQAFQNVSVVNPAITNPGITNPAITNASIANPAITNPAITNVNPANTSVSDTQWTATNTGNTEGSFAINLASSSPVPLGNVLQLIISKLYQTPAAPTGQDCNLKLETHNVVVTNIVNPVLLNPANPAITNPGITNPAITNATVALAPGETANIIIRVVNTNTAVFPTFNPAASVAPVVVAQAVPTLTVLSTGGGGTPPPPPVTVPPLQITTTSLPDAVTGLVYTAGIQTVGGNPTAHSFSLTGGALPAGLSLDPVTGAITGVVTASGVATFSFTVQVQDVGSPSFPQHTATQSLSIRVGSRMVFSPLTLPSATQGTSYSQTISVTGGLGTISQVIASGNLPPGLTLSLSGLISGIPTASGPFSFTVQAADSASPPQIVSQGYTINVVGTVQVPANVTFVTQPGNSVGGQVLGGSPVIVQVTDNTGAAIPNAPVAMSFSGTPPCSAATLTGTLSQTTNAQGQATFNNLSIDRGQLGYTLLAISANATAVSNPFALNGFCATATLSTPRELHTQVLLGNGKVLIAGGISNASTNNALSTAELYDPITGTVSPTGNLTAPNGRALHASVLLPNGQVLLVGGFDNTSVALATAELYNPASGTFTSTGSMAQARDYANAVLLANGKVLVSGGVGFFGQLNTAEIYDPATGVFTPTGNLNQGRARHTATLLPNGTVLVAGGHTFGGRPITVFASAEIFDPAANNGVGAFTSIGSMDSPRTEGRATLLPNGTVLLAGGFVTFQATVTASTSTAEIFDPATNTFTLTGNMSVGRAHPTASLLPDGTVLVAGGVPDTGATTPASPTADIFNPSNGTFGSTGLMITQREYAQAVVLPSGNPLISGGDDGVNTTANEEIYYSTAAAAPLVVATTSLPNGIVNQAYTRLLLQQGGVGSLTWTLTSGALPAGMTLGSNGILTGTPTATGSFPFTVLVVDSSNPQKTATATLALTIIPTPPLVFTSASMPTAVVGQPYIQALPVAGGTQPYNATVTSGTLPPGLSLSNGGVLNGTATGTGSFTFTVTVTDSSTPTKTATQTFTMAVNTLVITTTVLPNGIVGVPYNATIATAGGTLPLSFSLTNTAFPPGLLIQQPSQVPASPNGALAGTPTLAGTYTFSESVVDRFTPVQTATQNYVVTIAPSGTAAPANVTFVSQPQNSVGGQLLSGGPVVVRVTDANNTTITGTTVVMSFNGAPPCSVANLSGTLSATTDGSGLATFSNLSIDRGQFGYTLVASTGSASAVSAPFPVQGFCASGNLTTQHEEHTQVLLNTGKVLLAGGFDNLGNTPNTAELYDPATGTSSPTGNLSDPNGRALQVSVVLQNGKVLSIGGTNNTVGPLATAELYDPVAGTFTPTGSMSQPRYYAAGVLLADGRVLVTGGFNTAVGSNTAEIYDPATGLFTPTGNMTQRRGRHAMTLLPNGKVLVTGGRDAQQNFFALSSAEIFDPSANQGVGAFTPVGNMNSPRHVHASTLLSNGTVLVSGGFTGAIGSSSAVSAETFDPATNVFTLTGNMSVSRSRHTSTLLPDGSVLVGAGVDRQGGISSAAPAELYSPTSRAFSPAGPMTTGREFHRATLLPNGNALLAGGDDGVNVLPSTEIYYNTAAVSPLVITTTSVPNGTISQPYVQMLLEQGGLGTLTWSQPSGTLPPGITFGTNGILSGKPTASGSFTFTVQVTDSSSPARTATATFTINVSLATLAFTSNTMPTAAAGRFYSQPLPLTGGTQPYSATVTSGTLPPGLALSSAGILSGTPSGAGSFTFTATVTDSSTPLQTATQTLTIAVNTLSVTTTALPSGIVGVPYSAAISTSGGTLPLAFSAANAAFPPGLAIQQPASNSQSGALAGTPTAAGHYTFSESVSDSSIPAQVATQYYVMDVFPAGTSVPATVTFLTPPQNSIGGQILAGTPIRVHVTDANNAPIAGASVAISFNGAPPCSSAALSGTLNGVTNGNGNAVFFDLSIDRGQLGYTLLASAGSASAVSPPITVNGFCNTGSMATARALLNSVTLLNGKVLIAGGAPAFSNQAVAFSSAELYDPAAHAFTAVGSMHSGRSGINMALLQNGQVLVAGGSNGSTALSSAELFDPSTNTFTLLASSMSTARAGGLATLLANGKVLITGGNLNGTVLASAEIFDPATNTFTATSQPMTSPRELHEAILLPNGKVLITGGFAAFGTNGPINPLATAELYDPVTDTFTATGSMAAPRYEHASALLFTGKVLAFGGFTANNFTVPLATAELYDPSTGTFSPTATAPQAGAGYLAPVPVLPDGTVGLYGVAIYDPATATYQVTGSTTIIQAQPATSLLADGTALVTGGVGSPTFDTGLANAEVYYSTAPLAPLQITTPSPLPGARLGQAYTQMLLERGGVGTLTWTLTGGALPTGITLGTNGILLGTPSSPGAFSFTVQLVDSSVPGKTATANFSLTITSPLSITTTSLPGGTVGTPYNAGIISTGGVAPVTFAMTTGALPNGLSLSPSGVLSGTATVASTFTFTVTATDSSTQPQSASQAYTVTIASLVISSLSVQPSSPTILVGGVQQFIAVATLPGGGTQNLTTSVTWNSSNTATATISNAPGTQGFATGLAAGTVTITANLNGVAGSAVLNVVSTSTATQFTYVANKTDGTISVDAIGSTGGVSPISGSPFAAGVTAPNGLAVDPTARFMYVSTFGGTSVSGLAINGASGALIVIPGSPFSQGTNPVFVAADPTGRFVYTSNLGSDNVSVFTMNQNTGALTPIAASPFAAGSQPRYVAVDPKGRFAYIANCGSGQGCTGTGSGSVTGYSIDPVTGALTPVPGSPFLAGSNPFGVTVDPTGRFIYVANTGSNTVSAFTIDPNSGALSAVTGSPFQVGTQPWGLTVDRAGKHLYVANAGSSNISGFTISSIDGSLTPISGSPFQAGQFAPPPTSVAVDATNQFLYASELGGSAVGFSINPTTGALTPVVGFGVGSGSVFIAVVQTSGTQAMNLATDGPLLAINRTFNATVTLTQPVPTGSSVTVSLAANPSGIVSISPATQTIQAGQTTAVFALTAGASAGNVVLTATATGYNNATAPLTVTSNLISFGTIPVLAPGQSGSLPVSLSFAAPAGGLTINFSSANSSVATITSSVFVPAGLLVPAANPQVTGVAIGATQITATAVGFAPDTGTVTITVTDSLSPTSINVSATRSANVTLSISAAAPVGGITFNLASDNTAAATVPATVTIPAGQLSVTFAVTGVAQGSANLTVTSPGITTITAVINVGSAPAISVSSPIIGNNLVAQGSVSLNVATALTPTNPTLTLTSSDPTHFLLTTDPAKVGTASVTLSLTPGSASVPAFYIEGQNFSGTNAITATLTATSPGYANGTAPLTLYPSGVSYYPYCCATFSTTTFSSPTPLTVYLVLLAPGSLNFNNLGSSVGQNLGPQAPGPTPVAVTSSNTSVGTVTGSPASIVVGSNSTSSTSFVPATVGTTNLNLATPTGYFTPANIPVQLISTVTAPPINLSSPIIGNNLIFQGNASLGAAPPSTPPNPSLTLTSSDPTHFLLSTSPTTVGSPSITLPLTPGSFSVPAFYVEGQNFSGMTAITATLTASSSGYANGTSTLTLYPSGVSYYPYCCATFSTTTFSSPTPLTGYLAVLNPGALNFYGLAYALGQPLGPQAPGPIPVAVTSSNAGVGTVTGSPASITVGSSSTSAISFVPATAGTTNLNLATPSGYSTPASAIQLVATVTAPTINLSGPVVGNNLIVQASASLGAATPLTPTNPTLTLTSSDPTHFLLTANPATVGTASITLSLTPGSARVPAFYIEGQNFSGSNAITATLTASAAGYTNGTSTLTLYPSGVSYYPYCCATFSTTTFSTPTTQTVYLAVLNPGTLNFYSLAYALGQSLGPQAPGPISVAVTSTNTSVGTVTGSPASIAVASNTTSAISFVPATAGTTNLNLATPIGYSTPASAVQLVATVTAPTLSVGGPIVGNNLITRGSLGLGAAPPSNEILTLTSSDPTHFLLSTNSTTVGTTSITLQLTAGSFSVPAFYIEGQNFSGIGAITATLTASAAGYSDGTTTLTLYPSGVSYYPYCCSTFTTTTSSPPTIQTVYLAVLNPGALNFYSLAYALGQSLGPQAPGPISVAVTSTNTSVGTVTGSPASIAVASNTTSAISFVPATAGTTNLNLATPAGYSTPASAVQIIATVQ